MKLHHTLCAALFAGLLIPAAFAQQQTDGKKRVVRDAAWHQAMAQKRRAAQANNPLANYKVVEGEDATPVHQPVDIVDNSDIISFNGLTTLVPKRAILTIPESVQNRIGKHTPGHRIVAWKEFLHANRGWITTMEVSRAQAEGRQPFNEIATERISKSSSLMVATYQGGPISVLPLREPETENESAAENDGATD